VQSASLLHYYSTNNRHSNLHFAWLYTGELENDLWKTVQGEAVTSCLLCACGKVDKAVPICEKLGCVQSKMTYVTLSDADLLAYRLLGHIPTHGVRVEEPK
jgi:hypothetical protein